MPVDIAKPLVDEPLLAFVREKCGGSLAAYHALTVCGGLPTISGYANLVTGDSAFTVNPTYDASWVLRIVSTTLHVPEDDLDFLYELYAKEIHSFLHGLSWSGANLRRTDFKTKQEQALHDVSVILAVAVSNLLGIPLVFGTTWMASVSYVNGDFSMTTSGSEPVAERDLVRLVKQRSSHKVLATSVERVTSTEDVAKMSQKLKDAFTNWESPHKRYGNVVADAMRDSLLSIRNNGLVDVLLFLVKDIEKWESIFEKCSTNGVDLKHMFNVLEEDML